MVAARLKPRFTLEDTGGVPSNLRVHADPSRGGGRLELARAADGRSVLVLDASYPASGWGAASCVTGGDSRDVFVFVACCSNAA